jgi:hypothetical protein
MSTTPRRHYRRASIGRQGDIASVEVVAGLEARVRAFLASATHGEVKLAYSERDSYAALFVCTPNALALDHQAAIRGGLARGLDPVGWSIVVDERLMQVSGAPSSTLTRTPTLILQYHSRAVDGPSFCGSIVRAVALGFVLLVLLYHLVWLVVDARA